MGFFAYGAEIDTKVMVARAGGYQFAFPAFLEGYRLSFQASKGREFGLANLERDDAGVVYGVFYNLTKEQMGALEKASGAPGFRRKIDVVVRLSDGRMVNATAFVLEGDVVGALPSKPYLESMMDGLRQFHGEEKIRSIEEAIKKT
ncbi:MAG: gamma-glutamylcyclotransferase family protein [Candidatus Anstonellaceae archaeon]